MLRPDEIVDEIKREINDDPTIEGRSHVLVFAGKKGFGPFKKYEIRLSGIVHIESDRRKAEEHARHAAGELPVVNEIEVVERSKKT